MNRREALLSLAHGGPTPSWVPAAFFLHFGPAYRQGQAAIERHLEFFRTTGMDLVKIQFEQAIEPAVREAADWKGLRPKPAAFFEPTLQVVRGLVQAAKGEAVVILTLYSPLMWLVRIAKTPDIGAQFAESPQVAAAGLEAMTETVLNLARAARAAGVDGFYASTQGGEAGRLPPGTFRRFIKPADLAVWEEIKGCEFNVLHICDYVGPYHAYEEFLDYPGHVVSAGLQVGDRRMQPGELAARFGRPFLGGMERLGVIATGPPEAVRGEAGAVLAEAPERFILGADCTVPTETPWENLQVAIRAAHEHRLAGRAA